MEESHEVHISKLNGFCASSLMISNNLQAKIEGHNYEVTMRIKSEKLSESNYVIDFGLVTPILKEICFKLDKLFLIPTKTPSFKFSLNPENNSYTIK